eukprot:622039-Pleurochrysis_carterae.AAC.1
MRALLLGLAAVGESTVGIVLIQLPLRGHALHRRTARARRIAPHSTVRPERRPVRMARYYAPA